MSKSLSDSSLPSLSRRERQIMDVLYRLGQASAAEVRGELPDPPSDSSVRTLLRVLEEKGHATHEQDGPRYVYLPTRPASEMKRSALSHLVETFFGGSPADAAAALLDRQDVSLTDDEAARIRDLIDRAKREGR